MANIIVDPKDEELYQNFAYMMGDKFEPLTQEDIDKRGAELQEKYATKNKKYVDKIEKMAESKDIKGLIKEFHLEKGKEN